jgi:hypothetical protein
MLRDLTGLACTTMLALALAFMGIYEIVTMLLGIVFLPVDTLPSWASIL